MPAVRGEPPMYLKFAQGAVTGGIIGGVMGFMFASFAVIRGGAPKGFVGTVLPAMATSGGLFSIVMGVGSIIRSEDHKTLKVEDIQAYRNSTNYNTRQAFHLDAYRKLYEPRE